jgi:hypothetical protein
MALEYALMTLAKDRNYWVNRYPRPTRILIYETKNVTENFWIPVDKLHLTSLSLHKVIYLCQITYVVRLAWTIWQLVTNESGFES